MDGLIGLIGLIYKEAFDHLLSFLFHPLSHIVVFIHAWSQCFNNRDCSRMARSSSDPIRLFFLPASFGSSLVALRLCRVHSDNCAIMTWPDSFPVLPLEPLRYIVILLHAPSFHRVRPLRIAGALCAFCKWPQTILAFHPIPSSRLVRSSPRSRRPSEE